MHPNSVCIEFVNAAENVKNDRKTTMKKEHAIENIRKTTILENI